MTDRVASEIQAPGGFGVNHDFTIAITAGDSVAVMVEDLTDITSLELLGASGSVGVPDFSTTSSPGGTRQESWSISEVPSGVTGVRLVTAGAHNDPIVHLLHLEGPIALDDWGSFTEDFTDVVAVGVTTTGTDSVLAAIWQSLSDTFTDDAGYAHTAEVSSHIGQYNSSALGAPGAETIGGTFSASNSRAGFAVAYMDGAPPPVLPPTYDNAPRFDLQRADDDEDVASAVIDAGSWF
jgi:hypothetical protein